MNYSGHELLWLFFVYSILGWVTETAVASGKKRMFVNRGFFTGPVCFLYGLSAVSMTVTLSELQDNLVFLFLGCAVQATFLEWVAGKTLERINRHKWWDYSDKKWNFDGYICMSYSVLWGVLGVLALKFGNEVFTVYYNLLPGILAKVLIWGMSVVALLDSIASFAAVLHMQKKVPRVVQFDDNLGAWTGRLRRWISEHMERRIVKAYPGVDGKKEEIIRQGHFAEGCGFYKLFWLFLTGAFLGDIIETIFCRFSMGYWMSRSSLVWGPFSIVWGLAIAMATALLHKDKEQSEGKLFLIGTLLGGVYEYVCSVFTELVFGKVFWDYSKMSFNLGGRINLLYCFFWGIAAVVWIKFLYPKISGQIEKIPQRAGKIVSWLLIAFMIVNIAVSMLALIRYDSRGKGIAPVHKWENVMDTNFDDERMQRIYPNAKQR